jgi:hypothetical protein
MIPRLKNSFIRPVGTGESWRLEIDPLPTRFENYFKESCNAAVEINDLKEGPLHLMYSGGIDSEYALNIFLHMGIDITPVIVRLLPDYNNHDIDYAFKFCQQHNLEPIVIDINFDEFVTSGKMTDINQLVKSSVIGRATTCYAMDFVDGSIICCEGDPHTIKYPGTEDWYFMAAQDDYTFENYMNAKGIDGTSFFNGYTPEMVSAFLVDPIMRDLADNKIPGKLGNKSSKNIIYTRDSNFEMETRPKYNGYEKILNSEIIKHPAFAKVYFHHKDYKQFEKERLDIHGQFFVKYYDLIKDLI